MKIYALIPARGGSKGLSGKNIFPLAGRPLISYSIEAANKSKLINETWVSTEDNKIKDVAINEGAKVLDRPQEIAEDFSISAEVVEHFIQSLKLNNDDIIVFLQPTSPLRDASDVDKSLTNYLNINAKMLLSVMEPEHTPLKAFIVDNEGFLVGAFSHQAPFTPRQKLPKAFMPNGAIYIFRVSAFRENNDFPQEQIYPWIMDRDKSVDVDTISDIKFIEKLLEQEK